MLQQGDEESLKSSDTNSELGAPDNDTSIDGDEVDAELDPRVQVELEKLNEATDIINRLEKQLDEAKAAGRQAFQSMTQNLHQVAEKLGKCIQKARPYYEARVELKKAQAELQQAALLFEKSNAGLKASKEIVKLTEEGLTRQGGKLDETWQEMLNYATKKVAQCENDLRQRQREHWHVSKTYGEAEAKVRVLERKFKSSIHKSKPYYELRGQMNHFVEKEKFNVYQLEQSISRAKITYADSLANLEGISEQIHLQRRLKDEIVPRDSGCGTISDSHSYTDSLDLASVSDINLDIDRLHSSVSANKNERNQKMLDTLHDIIYQSKYEEDMNVQTTSDISSLTATLNDNTLEISDGISRSHDHSNHSLKNAQNFPLLSALEKEMTRMHIEHEKTENVIGAKKSLQAELSVDSAMDSGSECEFEPIDDDLIDQLKLEESV